MDQAAANELVRRMPVLSTYYAMALQGMGHLEESSARLDDAERWLDGGVESAEMVVVDTEGFDSLASRAALARGYLTMAAGDVASTRNLADRR